MPFSRPPDRPSRARWRRRLTFFPPPSLYRILDSRCCRATRTPFYGENLKRREKATSPRRRVNGNPNPPPPPRPAVSVTQNVCVCVQKRQTLSATPFPHVFWYELNTSGNFIKKSKIGTLICLSRKKKNKPVMLVRCSTCVSHGGTLWNVSCGLPPCGVKLLCLLN